MMASYHKGIEMFPVAETIILNEDRGLFLIDVMILHAVRMLIPNVMIFRLAIGIVHPDSWMTSHADKTVNVIGVMTRPDIIEIHLGHGRILHTNGVTSTTTHAEPSFKSEGDHAQDARHEHEHD